MSLKKIPGFRIKALLVCLVALSAPDYALAAAPDKADRVAAVNGAAIDRAEFEGEVLVVQKAILGFGKPLTQGQVSSVNADVLESMIRREILLQESRKADIKPDESAVLKEIETLKKQFVSEAEYLGELARRNLSEEALRARVERNNLIQQYIERQFVPKVTVTDRDMIGYYEGNLDQFKQPLQAKLSHILVQVDPVWDKARKQESRKKAEQILKNLKKGQDFATIAREQSDGLTKANGGEIGYVRPGQIDRQFEGAVFALKPGETTELIETDHGIHIFKVTDRKNATVMSYEEVKDRILKLLRFEKAKQEADLYAKGLRDKASVETFLADGNKAAKQP